MPTNDPNGFAIFAGNSNERLFKEIAAYLGVSLGDAEVGVFKDGEIKIEIKENVRSKDVFVLQSTCPPKVNDYLMELVLMIDAFKRSSARRITVVIPYYGYARQDKKVEPRVPISAKVVADLITVAGAHRVISMDLHSPQIQGFFNIPVDNLFAKPILIEYVQKNFDNNLVLVSADAGGAPRTRSYAKKLKVPFAIIDKERERPNECRAMNIVGDVSGKDALILDDMIDTAGTLCEAAASVKEKGAKRVFACCVHPVLSGPAVGRIMESCIERLVVTNTIPLNGKAAECGKIDVLSIAELVGEAVIRCHRGDSVTSLFV